jgi:hypothetical protein
MNWFSYIGTATIVADNNCLRITYFVLYPSSHERKSTLLLLISISITSIYGYDYTNQSLDIYAQNGSNSDDTVQVNCLDIALVLAVLDFSIELGDKYCSYSTFGNDLKLSHTSAGTMVK